MKSVRMTLTRSAVAMASACLPDHTSVWCVSVDADQQIRHAE
jgi:hypothetical protein